MDGASEAPCSMNADHFVVNLLSGSRGLSSPQGAALALGAGAECCSQQSATAARPLTPQRRAAARPDNSLLPALEPSFLAAGAPAAPRRPARLRSALGGTAPWWRPWNARLLLRAPWLQIRQRPRSAGSHPHRQLSPRASRPHGQEASLQRGQAQSQWVS